MGIHVCDNGDGVAFIYESTGMRPFSLAAFKDAEEADSFVEYVRRQCGFHADAAELEKMRDEWDALPRCILCSERVVEACEGAPDECTDCHDEDPAEEGDNLVLAIKQEARRRRVPMIGTEGLNLDELREALRTMRRTRAA